MGYVQQTCAKIRICPVKLNKIKNIYPKIVCNYLYVRFHKQSFVAEPLRLTGVTVKCSCCYIHKTLETRLPKLSKSITEYLLNLFKNIDFNDQNIKPSLYMIFMKILQLDY